MNAESVRTYRGTGGIHSNGAKCSLDNRIVQPSVPFGPSLMKPLCSKTESEELKLQQEAGRSLERLMNQQNHLFQLSTTQHRAPSDDIYILLYDYDAKLYDNELCRFIRHFKLEKGNFLRQISVRGDGATVLKHLKNEYRAEELVEKGIYVQCVDLDCVYARVTVTKLTSHQMKILKPIQNLDKRLRFFQSDNYPFVEQLKVGDEIIAQMPGLEQQSFLEGTIDWIGELKTGKGYYFWISLESYRIFALSTDSDGYSKSLTKAERANKKERFYFTGDQLRPKKNFSQASSFFSPVPKSLMASTSYGYYDIPRQYAVRDVPIRLVGNVQQKEINYLINSQKNESQSCRCTGNIDSNKVCARTRLRTSATAKFFNFELIIIRAIFIEMVEALNNKYMCNVNIMASDCKMIKQCKKLFSPLPRRSSSPRFSNTCFYDDISSKSSSFNKAFMNNEFTPTLEAEASSDISSASETFRVDPISAGIDIREGDKVIYTDLLSDDFIGTVRWVGYLKGQQQLFAGVEFVEDFQDKLFDKGVSCSEDFDFFCTNKNHVGFLPINEIKKISGSVSERVSEVPVPSAKEFVRTHQSLHVKNIYSSEPKKQLLESSCTFSSCQSSGEKEECLNKPLAPFPSALLTQGSVLGSCVVVQYNGHKRYGVVKWLGPIKDSKGFFTKSAAVEIVSRFTLLRALPEFVAICDGALPDKWVNALEESHSFTGQLLLNSTGEVTLVPVSALYEDYRFAMASGETVELSEPSSTFSAFLLIICSRQKFFMLIEHFEKCHSSCSSKIDSCLCMPATNIMDLVGRMKGIQGCKNSCYLDSTLYSMFVQSTAFDKNHFVSADQVSKLRELLQQLLPEMPGLTSDEKDPEELLTALFQKVFKAEPFLTMRGINDGKIDSAYICPIITDDVWSSQQRHMVCVQSLLERSLYSSGIQFSNEPKVLIIQLPRYGKEKVFCKVVPQQELDVTHLIYNMQRPCSMCNKQAELTCPECFLTKELLLSEVTYCDLCYKKAHAGFDHHHQLIMSDSNKFTTSKSHGSSIHKHKLQLSAVLSIETSHYVAFVRVPTVNKWLLFDSMADRVGLEDGYNVPKVKCCDRVAQWLSESGITKLRSLFEKEHQLPCEIENDPDVMRLISDCYICFYSSSDNR
uniref:USP domain-containing protein n=1 Tax=Syphacia muris TaxID=451379 RepID=A0A0N5AY01_9BILA